MNTEIISVSSDPTEYEKQISRAADIIKRGGLVVFPTETVYGLGADATSESAAGRIYEAKGRPSDNPLIIHVSSPLDAERYAYTNEIYYKLAERFMPGPLTVILDSKDTVPPKTRGGLSTVAVRCPESKIARDLIYASGVAIAAPSANLSGSPSPTNAGHVIDDMYGRVDMIIDGGESEFGLESTIVKIDNDGSLTLLRPGRITVEDLLEVVDNVLIADAVKDKLKDGETALSPGMKYRHYAPKAPLILVDGDVSALAKHISDNSLGNVAVICYDEDARTISELLPDVKSYPFGARGDEISQAHQLFSLLREIDKAGHSVIFAPLPSTDGVGLALYNRMIRAAAHTIINLR